MSRERRATEQLSFEEVLRNLPVTERHAGVFLRRIGACRPLPPGSVIADIGSGPGLFLTAFAKLGYRAVGVEPWSAARDMTLRVARHFSVTVEVQDGVAEQTHLPSESFDLVFCNNVIEHSENPAAAFNEAFRILRPGGAFWWSSANSLAPHQAEISGYPLFGWYPDRLKRRIMEHARAHKPHLVGFTDHPAIHWWTPWKARRMLAQAGFQRVLDRWDIRRPEEGGKLHAFALRNIQSGTLPKLLAEVCAEGCAYLALKPLSVAAPNPPQQGTVQAVHPVRA